MVWARQDWNFPAGKGAILPSFAGSVWDVWVSDAACHPRCCPHSSLLLSQPSVATSAWESGNSLRGPLDLWAHKSTCTRNHQRWILSLQIISPCPQMCGQGPGPWICPGYNLLEWPPCAHIGIPDNQLRFHPISVCAYPQTSQNLWI